MGDSQLISQIIEFDKELMLAINGCTNGFLDFIMPIVTYKYTGIPIYVAIIAYIFIKFQKKEAFIILLATVATFALCDSLSVALFKETFHRLRPGWDPELMEKVRMLEYKGGQYGFVSSHAANLFGIATITSLLLKNRLYGICIFSWAIIVGYSRVYVGKHFPADVICGAIFGIIVAYFVHFVLKKVIFRGKKGVFEQKTA